MGERAENKYQEQMEKIREVEKQKPVKTRAWKKKGKRLDIRVELFLQASKACLKPRPLSKGTSTTSEAKITNTIVIKNGEWRVEEKGA